MGVDDREYENIGYTCRSVALMVFGQGFDSPHLHQFIVLNIQYRTIFNKKAAYRAAFLFVNSYEGTLSHVTTRGNAHQRIDLNTG